MRILITGACGFVGAALASCLLERADGLEIVGIDNLIRPGAETNRQALAALGVRFLHADLRVASDLAGLPACDWVIDAAANPSVLAGLEGGGGSRRLLEHNLFAMGNVLEYCREHGAGLLLVSSSRVYSIPALCAIPLRVGGGAFLPDTAAPQPYGLEPDGIGRSFSTAAPISLYGATKLASETLALEYAAAFGLPTWINRCGVMAGPGQFGTPAQGIFAYWINAHLRRRPLVYIGFEGTGHQTRDALHPHDLAALLLMQMRTGRDDGQRVYTVGGGPANAMSLAQLTAWCDARFGTHVPGADVRPRPYDIPWVAMSNADVVRDFGWRIEKPIQGILDEIARHAEAHPGWLDLSGV